MMERFRGGELATILNAIEIEHQINLNRDFVSSYRSLVDELFERELKPCEGVESVLTEIELPKCVASSGPLEKINKALSVSGLVKHFNGKIFSSYVVGSWKPIPEYFCTLQRKWGFCLVSVR